MEISIRFGQVEDTEVVTDFILHAGAGLFEFLLNGLIPGVNARNLLRMAVVDMDSVLCYSNAVLAECNGQAVGMVLSYPSNEYGIPPLVKTIVPRKRLDHVRSILESRVENSWYVNSLVVAPLAQGQGVARLLLECMSEVAVENGFEHMSLHVWADNTQALKLYEKEGFKVVRNIDVEPSETFEHNGGMKLMQASLPLKPDTQGP